MSDPKSKRYSSVVLTMTYCVYAASFFLPAGNSGGGCFLHRARFSTSEERRLLQSPAAAVNHPARQPRDRW
ncbi:hypothetical protein Mal15_15250 [Stieleria maiorica]|uniref:Uncharacterized protein n=1 Tax=Stieleria maiorica TaxID=2795974 RepID=A0A5B9MDC0_9BACT|nr:hypothetical protein Mal15_15250 [Stieleria maiorica]